MIFVSDELFQLKHSKICHQQAFKVIDIELLEVSTFHFFKKIIFEI